MNSSAGTPVPAMTATSTAPAQRGIAHLMHPTVLGSLIGAGGASAFVLANRDDLPAPWSRISLLAWVIALAVFAYAVLLRPRALRDPGPPHPAAGLVYVGGLVAMVAMMAGGRLVLNGVDRPELQPAVVVIAVGLHFVPFAWAFRAPIFGWIGWALAGIGCAGLIGGLVAGAEPVRTAAVLTGLVMLAFMALNTRDGFAASTGASGPALAPSTTANRPS